MALTSSRVGRIDAGGVRNRAAGLLAGVVGQERQLVVAVEHRVRVGRGVGAGSRCNPARGARVACRRGSCTASSCRTASGSWSSAGGRSGPGSRRSRSSTCTGTWCHALPSQAKPTTCIGSPPSSFGRALPSSTTGSDGRERVAPKRVHPASPSKAAPAANTPTRPRWRRHFTVTVTPCRQRTGARPVGNSKPDRLVRGRGPTGVRRSTPSPRSGGKRRSVQLAGCGPVMPYRRGGARRRQPDPGVWRSGSPGRGGSRVVEGVGLVFGLDAFGKGVEVQGFAEPKDGSDEGGVVAAGMRCRRRSSCRSSRCRWGTGAGSSVTSIRFRSRRPRGGFREP